MKVSVITTVYNAAEVIEATLCSVLEGQGEIDLEYIVTDGGSDDNTAKIVARYPEVEFYSEPDEGIYDGMNKGIKKASGDVIAILNAGDLLLPGILQKVLQIAENHPEVGVFHGGMIWTEKGVPVREVISQAIHGIPDLNEMPVCHPASFVRKDVYEKFGVFDKRYKIAADHHFIHRTLRAGVKYQYLPFFCTYMDNGGVSSAHRSTIRDEVIQTIEELGESDAEKNCAIQKVHKTYYKQFTRDWFLNHPLFPTKTLRAWIRKRRSIS